MRINTLPNLAEPAVQALLTFLRGCITSRLINYTGTFILSRVFMESTPPAARMWGRNKFNIIFPTLCSSHHDLGPDSAPPAASSYIYLNLFQHFLSTFKLPGLSPSTAISRGSTEPIMEDIYSIFQEEIVLHIKLCGLNPGYEASFPPYLLCLIEKHFSKSIWDQIITSQVRNAEYYDGHRVPLPVTFLKTIKKRKYISEDPDIIYRTA